MDKICIYDSKYITERENDTQDLGFCFQIRVGYTREAIEVDIHLEEHTAIKLETHSTRISRLCSFRLSGICHIVHQTAGEMAFCGSENTDFTVYLYHY